MANYAFSATTGAFYAYSLKDSYDAAGSWPSDAVDVDDSVYNTYTNGTIPTGQMRGVGNDGLPAWVNIPALTTEQLTAQATNIRLQYLSAIADELIYLNDKTEVGTITTDETTYRTNLINYRIQLYDLDLTTDPANVSWPVKPTPPSP